MNDYIFLMHNDAPGETRDRADEWAGYIAQLQRSGIFQGGSAIGDGACVSKAGASCDIMTELSGFIRVQAESLEHARKLVHGNPVFEVGGTVEIRELPKT